MAEYNYWEIGSKILGAIGGEGSEASPAPSPKAADFDTSSLLPFALVGLGLVAVVLLVRR